MSYALHLINHPSKDAVLAEVEKKATTQGNIPFLIIMTIKLNYKKFINIA